MSGKGRLTSDGGRQVRPDEVLPHVEERAARLAGQRVGEAVAQVEASRVASLALNSASMLVRGARLREDEVVPEVRQASVLDRQSSVVEAEDDIVSDLLSPSHIIVEVPPIIEGLQHDTVFSRSVINNAISAAASVENEDVGLGTSRKKIGSTIAIQAVVSSSTKERVVAIVAPPHVMCIVAVDLIVVVASLDPIIKGSPADHILACTTREAIGAIPAS